MIIEIPTSLKDITISQLMAYDNSLKETDDLIRCLCGVENPKQIKASEYKELANHLEALLKQEALFNKTFKHKGVSFGFIPKLDDISTGAYLDLENYIANKEYHKAMAIMFRPVIKQKRNWFNRKQSDLYDIKAYTGTEQWCEEMLDVSCVYYLGAIVFFYNLSSDLLNYLKDYSIMIMERLEAKKSKSSTPNMAGM